MNKLPSLNSAVSVTKHQASDNIGDYQYYIGDFPPWYPQIIEQYYPIYYPVYQAYPNRFEQAFKIVMKLMEKKIIKIDNVQQFTEVINSIVDIL